MLCLLMILFCTSVKAQEKDQDQNYKTESGYYTSFDDTRIYYEVKGKGRPIVLVHGFIANGESWKHTILYNDLIKKGYKVVTLDLRGNGRSDKPGSEEGYASDAEARDIMGLVRYLRLGKYYVVGYSRGSIITARLLVKDKKVKKAVLGGMGADFTNPQWPRRIRFYEALSGKPDKELEGMVNAVKKQGLDTMALAYMQKYQPSTSPGALYKVHQRVLVINGDHDRDNGSPEDLAKMLRNVTLATIPGDHNSALRSKEFSETVISFLD
jgi:pimeloyl-ACP methyl ester carboxylesterase